MPEQTGGPGDAAGARDGGPDFFDRLLARHAPAAARPAEPGVARVRPRLAGPFERVEAVRGADGAEEADESMPLWPPADSPSTADGPAAALREIRTEHEHTVVHTRPAPGRTAPEPRTPARPTAEAPLLRPATPLTPRQPRPAAARQDLGTRPDGERAPADRATGPAPLLTPTAAAAPPSAAGPLRPVADGDGTAARGAARAAMARRGPRGGERVVRVQIGRLEVNAAAAPGAGSRRPDPPPTRTAATVSLEEYLRRGRDVDGGRT